MNGYCDGTKSLCMIHNETTNIWSHLVCFIYFLYTLYQIMSEGFDDKIFFEQNNKTLLTIATLSGMLCMGCSSIYHLYKDISS